MTAATQIGSSDLAMGGINGQAVTGGTSGIRLVAGSLFRTRGRAVRFSMEPPPPPKPKPEAVHRPARLAVMLALAHRLQATIDEGESLDRAEAARRLGLTRARMTQLMDLTLLAPDLQEQVLFLEATDGVEPITERMLRPVVAAPSWGEQRRRWAGIVRKAAGYRSKPTGSAMGVKP